MHMEELNTRVHLAGFSRHELPFHYVDQKDGLNSYLFRLQTEGCAKALVDGRLQMIQPGDLLLYQPGDPYELYIEDFDLRAVKAGHVLSGDYYVFCSGSWIANWWKQRQRAQKAHTPLDDRLISIWRQCALEQVKMDAVTTLISDHLLKVLCWMMDRVMDDIGSQHVSSGAFIPYRMRAYIDEHATEPFKVKDVANHVGLSASRAMYLFKESFGVTMKQHAMDVRLNLARNRIAFDDLPLEDIAVTCGFTHYTYFYRVFRSRFGKSPSVYRQENR